MSDRQQKTVLNIPLDDDTVSRLMNLSGICGSRPADVAASLLHDILKDDEDAHFLADVRGPVTVN